ncbi:hypothetical protein NEF87_002862 [Candidatus Lokiarchaeum ossiferum]|uniref:Alginate lyase domain-containing protein n=1 Tax=Candidatus Lokiarchaeum ossiferum TaxID=2951803 RepID=A0ABY6HST8_9ARCH|nr:hypothetical protein NEF87_002862 [Candidatus Lokiarchaeum sp. B-35]
MRVRNRTSIKIKTIFTILLIFSPFTFFTALGIRVASIYDDMLSFQYEVGQPNPDEDFLYPTANYTRMNAMARVYDYLYQKNHLPLNFTATCDYVDENYTEVASYQFSDNGALWTGIPMAGWVFHYVAAQNEGNVTDIAYALEVIQRMVNGFSMLMIVPNGGLGPEYSGILARGWAGPEHKDIHPSLFQDHIRHFNGTGDYSNYRWRGHTSNDEYAGFYLGLAVCLKYVEDPYVQTTVGLIVEQLANYMRQTNFLGINGPGGPSGVEQKARVYTGGYWVSLLLKMAAMVNPEEYEEDYYHYVAAEMGSLAAAESADTESMANYYAYNFAHCVVFAFLLLEGTETKIGQHYYNHYFDSLRTYTQYHRNPWFNVIFLALSAKPGDYPIIERDIEDQLLRMQINHFPDRHYPTLPVPDSYERNMEIPAIEEDLKDHNWWTLYKLLFIETDWQETYYTKPLTVEYMRSSHFIWEKNPWELGSSSNNTLHEEPGATFFTPYWIGRAFGFIQPTGIRVI